MASDINADSGKRKMNLALKILLWVVGVIVGLVLVIVIGLNIYVRIEYAGFYEDAQREFDIPGIADGFVPQDLDYVEESGIWLFSGYVSDSVPSPVYRMFSDGSTDMITLEMPDGTPYTGHGGGITSNDEYMFITTSGGYLVFRLSDVIGEAATPKAMDFIDVGFSPAFLNIEDDRLYLGDYYYPGSYETPELHHIEMPDGVLNQAVMYSYPESSDGDSRYGFASLPDQVFSIPDSIQGFCLDSDGNFVLCASANIQPTLLYRFDSEAVLTEQMGTFDVKGDDVPLYGLWSGNQSGILEGPPMGEGIESANGLVYLTEESASNKYIFGKLYGAGAVYALPF